MDKNTKSTAGSNCGKHNFDGPNEGVNAKIENADCGNECDTSASCCNAGLYCDPFTKKCLDKSNDAVAGPYCG